MTKLLRVATCFTLLIFSNSLLAKSTVFEVSRGKNKLFIAGTIHMLRSEDFPPPQEFNDAYKQSNKIYFETDIQKAQSSEFGRRFAQAMILPVNNSLKNTLTPKNWSSLQAYAQTSQFPLEQVMMFNAAMVSILITMHESKKLNVGKGVDAFYDEAARAEKKYVGELETGEEFIAIMEKFAQEDANKIIESTLEDAANMTSNLADVITKWRDGDLEGLNVTYNEKLRTETPLVYQSLVVERNQKWLPKIKTMLATPEIEMVLVGSLHLCGKDGLLAQLEKSGFKVRPYEHVN